MYAIIAGCGRVGSRVARRLVADGHQVVVIDDDPGSFRLLGDDFPGQCVVGAAINWETLRDAGIEGADAFASVTGGDNTNIVCALIASRAFEVPCSIARVYDPDRARVFSRLGLRTVCPTDEAETTMLDLIRSCPAADGKD